MKYNQKGSAGIIALGILGVISAFAIMTIVWAISLKNEFGRLESDIVSSDRARKINLSQYTLRIIEMAKVPKMQREDLKETIEAQLRARYGDKGSVGVVQILKENNIAVNSELYNNLEKEINGGRKDYEQKEIRLEESKKIACNRLKSSPGGDVLRMFGYPTIHFGCMNDRDDYALILSESSKDTFETGVDKGVNF